METPVQIVDCECNGSTCCAGVGIAVFSLERDGKKMRVCTQCKLSDDKNIKILRYVTAIPVEKLMDFDSLGAISLAISINSKQYPLTEALYG